MMTRTQLARLPGIARAIIDTDRSIAAIVGRPVVALDQARKGKELAELIRDRRVLTTRAHETWGKPLRGDGAGTA